MEDYLSLKLLVKELIGPQCNFFGFFLEVRHRKTVKLAYFLR